MGRIERGGGNGGEPVRSPLGRLSFRRPHAGIIPAFDLIRRAGGMVASTPSCLGALRRIPFQRYYAYNHRGSRSRRAWALWSTSDV